MNNQNLDSFVAVPISTDIYMAIAKRCPSGVSSLIEDVVWAFLDRTAEGESLPTTALNGVYWGPVFLPSGTKLRVSYHNQYKYAEILEDEIVYEGESVSSVSKLASKMRSNTSVNAWKYVELMRPSDKIWIFADIVRRY